jgi:hypothetical protein
MNLPRRALSSLALAALAATMLSGCVIAPNVSSAEDVAKMSERASATCGAGQVKEVNAKSFACK